MVLFFFCSFGINIGYSLCQLPRGVTQVTVTPLNSVEADLHFYLRDKRGINLPTFSVVVADVLAFTSSVNRSGFRIAFTELLRCDGRIADRSFIEAADLLVDYHLRLANKSSRDLVRKSVLEAYFHAAGPQNVFEPPVKTQFVRSLRKWGPRDFAALLLSLYVFNSISLTVQEDIRAKMSDVRSFELYMLGLETICRDTVKAAANSVSLKEPGELWAREVLQHVEEQLLHAPSAV
jgi:hypothetical protein